MTIKKSSSVYSLDPIRNIERQFTELVEIRELTERLTGHDQHHKIKEALQELIDRQSKLRCPAHFLVSLTGPKQAKVQETWESFVRELTTYESGAELGDDLDSLRYSETIEDARSYFVKRVVSLRQKLQKDLDIAERLHAGLPARQDRFQNK